MSSGSASAHVHAMHASCALLVSSRIVCRCIDHQAFACLCMRGRDENSWQSRPRHTRARNKVLLSAALVVPSAQPPKSECERAARRLPSKRRRRPTFFAIVLPSSSNMTLARSAAVVPRGGSHFLCVSGVRFLGILVRTRNCNGSQCADPHRNSIPVVWVLHHPEIF